MCLSFFGNFVKKPKRKFLIDVVCKSTLKSPSSKLIEVQCSEAEKSILHKPHNNFAYLKVKNKHLSLKFLGEKETFLSVSLQRVVKVFVYSSKILAVCYVREEGDLTCLILRDILSDVKSVEDALLKSLIS